MSKKRNKNRKAYSNKDKQNLQVVFNHLKNSPKRIDLGTPDKYYKSNKYKNWVEKVKMVAKNFKEKFKEKFGYYPDKVKDKEQTA